MKALAVLRVSTTSQQIEDQKEELYAYIKSMGYDEIEPVEAIGASAIKLDEKYLAMAENVKERIMKGGIDAVAVWEISRLGRNEVILMGFKEFFIENKVQFICKNPSLKLLNDDGSVNSGTELAFSLFATMAKQEMQEKKARFKRAKTAMASRGEYIGGNVVPFGYRLEGKYFVEDEEKGAVVRLLFDLYSSGNYSSTTLEKEMEQRGYSVNGRQIVRILGNKAYIGERIGVLGVHYPPLISMDVWDKCREVRERNRLDMRRGGKVILGSKLIKCPCCGSTCTSNTKHYVCSNAAHHNGCENRFAVRKYVADGLLWRVASTLHLQYLMDINQNKVEEYKKELETVNEKIRAGQDKMASFEQKKDRIVDSYIEGKINKKNCDLRLSKLQDDIRVHRGYLSSLQAKRDTIAGMLEVGNPDSVEAFEAALDTLDIEDKFEVIHKHIKSLVARQVSYGKRDPRTTRPNGVEIVITTILGNTHKFLYFPKCYQGHNLYLWNGRKWCEDGISPSLD